MATDAEEPHPGIGTVRRRRQSVKRLRYMSRKLDRHAGVELSSDAGEA